MESPQAVHDYFEELGNDGRKLNEVKIIFLGEASAGKTSLVKRLMNDDFNPKENQTHGIRIRKTPFTMRDADTVTAHLWDFGGQEVMRATHQLFLSQRSIYVLLLNSRNDDQAEKWLKHAASFGGHSPVLVVLNKIDENPSFEVNRKNLREKYPQIRDFFRLSCQNQEGIKEFHQALCQEIESADTRRTPFPSHWLAVKDYFSNEMKSDYIESAQYREICIQNGVSRQFSQDVLLQFLHDLGVIINFRNLKNFDTHILNPLWLTNGIYRIINSKIVGEDTKGLLHEDDFDAVPRYLKELCSRNTIPLPQKQAALHCAHHAGVRAMFHAGRKNLCDTATVTGAGTGCGEGWLCSAFRHRFPRFSTRQFLPALDRQTPHVYRRRAALAHRHGVA